MEVPLVMSVLFSLFFSSEVLHCQDSQQISALDRLSLRCAAIITMRVRTPARALKQGTLPHLLHLWTLDRDVNVGPVGRI